MQATSIESSPVLAPHRKLTVEQYHRMGETGILHEDDRVELIEGELIEMAPIVSFHAGLGSKLADRLIRQTMDRAIPWVQNPIHLSRYSEPQPDFALLRYRPDYCARSLPTAADVLLLVAIADTTTRYDREIKAPLYARHRIAEYWLISVPERGVEVHLEPDPDLSRYGKVRMISEGRGAPHCFPDVAVDIEELLS